jgi:pimeloyl-ACP methyl ester carboxylesterase
VAEFLGGSPEKLPDVYRAASPAELRIQAKQILLHGTSDDSVPYELSANYVKRKKQSGENVELITFENTGHFELVDPESAVWSRVLETFRTSLL